jgi:cobalamin-dependent methionine synthase I
MKRGLTIGVDPLSYSFNQPRRHTMTSPFTSEIESYMHDSGDIVAFDAENYSDIEEAKENDAVYVISDAANITESNLFDVADIMDNMLKMIGITGNVYEMHVFVNDTYVKVWA